MIKGVIFDFDGTIADTLPYTFLRIVEISKKYNVKDSQKEIIKKIRQLSPNQLMKEFKISWFKIPIILWEIKRAQRDLYYHIDRIRSFSGIKNLLKELNKKKIDLYIYSSNIKKNIEKFLKKEKIDSYFKKVYTGSNLLGKDKDLIRILKKEKLTKDEIIYIGDEIRDVLACKKAGIKIIGVSWGLAGEGNLKEIKPDFIVKKPNDILRIVEKLNKKPRN